MRSMAIELSRRQRAGAANADVGPWPLPFALRGARTDPVGGERFRPWRVASFPVRRLTGGGFLIPRTGFRERLRTRSTPRLSASTINISTNAAA